MRVREWIDAATASERLGVKPATLYAYVSRGVLTRRHGPDGRRSLFASDEIEALAERGRPRRAPSPGELAIESAVTAMGKDRHYYRGQDATALAAEHTFEEIASFLWTSEFTAGPPWRSPTGGVAAAIAAQSGLPAELLPLDRLQVITTTLAVTDPRRIHLDRDGVIDTARGLIAGMVDALPSAGEDAGSSIAGRLWGRLSPNAGEPALVRALEAAMVLLADHELAASTLAARVAASVRADPYAVVTAGLGVVSGPLHGGASYGAERLLAEIGGDPGRAARVVADRLRAGERIPGFGHSVYKTGDYRFDALLSFVGAAAPGHPGLAVIDAVRAEAARRRLPEPNVDLALACLTTVAGMPAGSGEAIFAVSRTAGWIAHALEEYEGKRTLRPRAVYTGPAI